MNLKFKFVFLTSIVLLVAITLILMITSYNRLINMDEDINSKYSQVENRLQERSDKINQIVSSVSGLQEHAETIYTAITDARAAYQNADSMDDLIAADAMQSRAFSNFLVVVESNPNITATSAYLDLIYEISMMESMLSVARRDFNTAVQSYNSSVRRFPMNFYASLFGFEKSFNYWKLAEGATDVPNIDFND